ncbi:pentapeptide repeat-containing protein [Saccharopolyspora dendranthemae]|uniref:Pentapeptide repeat protein n=1 Tax=Saccharopolyspora dendranthemae TaxID=1181886 RepID=A0A561U1X6_9PSEU|nr:pentapeptide repeat-containing protein [Saccharopolyspora dendranthemae]TWF93377.1 pentapeptide repeat protein [Saccharopolyspora dendranthemae]
MSELYRVRAKEAPQPADRAPSVMPAWSIWLGAGLLLLVATTSMWALLTLFGTEDKVQLEANKVRLEIIKLSGSVVIGTGGAAALLLAARRQRSTELSIAQTERDLAYKEHDANERRATDLYIAATEQLGSDKAPVRLAGLYALERFGQSNPEYRQTVVDVLCAYLRMPFAHPDDKSYPIPEQDNSVTPERRVLYLDLAPTLTAAAGLPLDGADRQRQEQQVRLTAQRILVNHIHAYFDESGNQKIKTFWPGMNLDLTGAALEDVAMFRAHVRTAKFNSAVFYGKSHFNGAQFSGFAEFRNAVFHNSAIFKEAKFHTFADFEGAQFPDWTRFDNAHLTWGTFEDAHFPKLVSFEGAHFFSNADFNRTRFEGEVNFQSSYFHNGAFFLATKFTYASFEGARLRTDVDRRGEVWPVEWLPEWTDQDEGEIEGLEGNWIFLTRTPDPDGN